MVNEYYNDKIAIVTGGNSGIGFGICEELLKRGSKVYMLGRNPKKVEKAISKLEQYDGKIFPLIADVSKKDEIQGAIKDTYEKEGRIDFLFNNAGITDPNLAVDATIEDCEKVINTNLWSIIYGVNEILPIIEKQGSGHVVNTASLGGLIPKPHGVLYATTKFATVGLTESLRMEYADKENINFSTICPGVILTEIFLKNKGEMSEENEKVSVEDLKETYKDLSPILPNEAAVEILDRVEAKEGVIIVPKQPWTKLRNDYVTGSSEADKLLLHGDPKQKYQS